MIEIGIFNETKDKIEYIDILKPLLLYALEKENLNNLEFNVIIINNDEIWKINKEYRGIDRPTDVISFALEDFKDVTYQDNHRVLGDIYISIDKVKEQAKEYGHSEMRELAFLAVHGLLHLLGYDHMNKEDEKIMFEKQELILNGFGISKNS
ncbi:MAG: rRNA maturation RNase YbeY [Clostridium sp.]|nr:rRNA maturation RNase YbeY [Clostridium sp.]MCM1444282.1 rRNA maturation RNase YbeY [Candidatus Amulumruptor caecigallinarius]